MSEGQRMWTAIKEEIDSSYSKAMELFSKYSDLIIHLERIFPS